MNQEYQPQQLSADDILGPSYQAIEQIRQRMADPTFRVPEVRKDPFEIRAEAVRKFRKRIAEKGLTPQDAYSAP